MSNIIIVDDHPVARLAVRMLLEKDGHMIVGESGDGMDALRLITKIKPDLAVVDLDIPEISGIDLIEKLRTAGFNGRILVLTARDDDHYLHRCIKVGADGFVGKKNNLEELGDAVRAVSRGYGYFPLNRGDNTSAKPQAVDTLAIQNLSSRELEVLKFISRGFKIVDIATRMHVSSKTVSTYKTRLLTKLELRTTLELIDFARRYNLD
ncbi:response regulator [Enterobacter asburiae]|uniref:response regulator n=2 Tax=Enterobacter asburiae TaxID=61645 RepID=UPI001CBC9639|nr:response regulator [Enterobacter asburiae]UAN34613.1 response regulator [Enterobacter asburiae]